jgi:hypothetical protein
MKTFLLPLLAIVAFTVRAQPPGATEQPPGTKEPVARLLRFDFFIARLPEARALELLPSLRDEAQCGAMQKTIIGLIAKKEAELVDCQTLLARSGQRAVVENTRAILFATEYAPWNEPAQKPAKAREDDRAGFPSNPTTPTAFQSRDVGITLELEATLQDDGQHVDMQVEAKHMALLGWSKITVGGEAGRRGGKQHVTVEQPEFQTLRVHTDLCATNGGSVLLGAHKLQTATQEVEVFILTTTVVKVR